MREPQQQQTLQMDDEATLVVGGEETTLVSPRFDDEETLVARPVVPFENGAPEPAPARGRHSALAPRRSGMLALALVSVLVGGVLGGAGLYLYQRQSHATTTEEQPAAPADDAAAQAPSAPAENQPAATNVEPQTGQTEPPTAAAAPDAEEPALHAPDEEVPAAAPAREPESVPAAERRTTTPAEGTPKRGKKGDRDEKPERRATSQPAGGNVARDEEPEARQVDTIFYRQRRAERQAERRAARRARRADNVDRLRRIFEGAPQ